MNPRSAVATVVAAYLGVVYVAGCSTRSRGGGGGSGDTLEVTFSTNPSSGAFAVAETADGAELAFFADSSGSSAASSINTRLSSGVVVKMSLDQQGRPEKVVSSEASASIEYEDGSAKVIVVAGDEVSETDVVISDSSARRLTTLDPTALQAVAGRLCSDFRTYVTLIGTLFDCPPDDTSLRCSPAFTSLAATTQRLCTDRERIGMRAPADLGSIATEAPLVPLRANATASVSPAAVGADVDLAGTATGGTGGYTFRWRVVAGPSLPMVADGQAASIHLNCPGEYAIRLIVVDSEGQRDRYVLPVTVDDADSVGTGPRPHFFFPDRDLLNPSVVAVVANLRDCNNDAQWRLSALFTPDEPGSAPQEIELEIGSGNAVAYTLASGDLEAGVYRLSLAATDSGLPVADTLAAGNADAIVTIDNAFSITILAGAAPVISAGPDRTVAPGAAVVLSCTQVGGDPATSFGWDQVGPSSVTLATANTATATFDAPDQPITLSFQCSANNEYGTGSDVVSITVQP